MRAGPLPGGEAPVPAQDGACSDQAVRPQLSRQEPDQRGGDSTIGPVQSGPRIDAAQHGDLMPQHQQLDVLGGRRPTEQGQPAAKPDEHHIEQAHRHGRPSCPTVTPGAALQLTDQVLVGRVFLRNGRSGCGLHIAWLGLLSQRVGRRISRPPPPPESRPGDRTTCISPVFSSQGNKRSHKRVAGGCARNSLYFYSSLGEGGL
jgi:hypothetical protein